MSMLQAEVCEQMAQLSAVHRNVCSIGSELGVGEVRPESPFEMAMQGRIHYRIRYENMSSL